MRTIHIFSIHDTHSYIILYHGFCVFHLIFPVICCLAVLSRELHNHTEISLFSNHTAQECNVKSSSGKLLFPKKIQSVDRVYLYYPLSSLL